MSDKRSSFNRVEKHKWPDEGQIIKLGYITITLKMAETLDRLGLFDKKEWFAEQMKFTVSRMLNNMEKDIYETKRTAESGYIGLHEQLRKAKEETKRSKGGARVLRFSGGKRSFDGRADHAES